MIRKTQLRINLPKYSPSAGISGAALSHTAVKIATPAHENMTLRKVPKTTKTPSTQQTNKMNGKMRMLALLNRPHTKIWRTIVTFRSSRTR